MTEYFLGCDVSKGYADFIILDSAKRGIVNTFQLDDTIQGHTALKKVIHNLIRKIPTMQLFAGVESTGGYENNWLEAFRRLGATYPIKSARINPCGVKKYSDAGLTRTITDAVSARTVAEYMIVHRSKISFDQDDPFYTLRRQWAYMSLLKKQQSQLHNQLLQFLYTANSSVLMYCRRSIPQWVMTLLLQYPTANRLAKAQIRTLRKIPFVSDELAKKMKQQAKQDIASLSDTVTEAVIIQSIKQIKMVESAIRTMEKNLEKEWGRHPTIVLLTSFKGIAFISALGLLINIKDVNLFPTAKHLASYFGLHPLYKQSGDGTWGHHMSKRGRVQPRAILFMVAMAAITHNPLIKDVYQKHRARNMKPLAALGVCMHKILRIVYGMLKSNTPFDPEIDRRNQKKYQSGKRKNNHALHDQKKRRLQQFDSTAPVSRRQAKKRERRNLPQSNNIT